MWLNKTVNNLIQYKTHSFLNACKYTQVTQALKNDKLTGKSNVARKKMKDELNVVLWVLFLRSSRLMTTLENVY